jgi:hypothetical protein
VLSFDLGFLTKAISPFDFSFDLAQAKLLRVRLANLCYCCRISEEKKLARRLFARTFLSTRPMLAT